MLPSGSAGSSFERPQVAATKLRIPFNRPSFQGKERQYLLEAADSGHWAGDGPFTKKCHRVFEEIQGVHKVLLTTSCTHALEMSALLLDIEPGDEVIVPSFTFVSTANAFALAGARIRFCDIYPDTLNLDIESVRALVTDRTRAVVPVHYAGVGCEMDALTELADEHDLAIVEDNAHGLFGAYRGRALGTFGSLATLSFHETKNFSCGEGGALLINDPELVGRAEIIREKGTNRSRFFRGEVDKYTWVDLGSSYLPSELLAAVLYAQLEVRDEIQAKRRRIWERYDEVLAPWAKERGIQTPHVPDYCEQTYHMYYMLFPDLDRRQALIGRLKEQGILSVFHYLPLHLSDKGLELGGKPGECPVTEDVSDRLLRLPFFNGLTSSEQDEVIEAVMREWDRL